MDSKKLLNDLLDEARNFADFALKHTGYVRPAMGVILENNPNKIQFFLNANKWESPKDKVDFLFICRLLLVAHGAVVCVVVLESFAVLDKGLKMKRPDMKNLHEHPDKKEVVVLHGASFDEEKTRICQIVRSDNEKYFGLDDITLEEGGKMTGQLGEMMPPGLQPQHVRDAARAMLMQFGITEVFLASTHKTNPSSANPESSKRTEMVLHSECPCCHTKMDRVTAVNNPEGRMPKAGELTICAHCAEILIFIDGQKLRQAELNDLMKLSKESSREIEAAQRVIRLHKQKGTL